jgi:cytochrome c6
MKSIVLTMTTAFVAISLSFPGVGRADGVDMFAKKCAACHGKDGKAQTAMGKKLGIKDLTDAKVQAAATDAEWGKTISEGAKDPSGKVVMPGNQGKISPDEVKDLVKYLRGLKGK